MKYPSQARKESMVLALAELDKVANPTICEVGRIRSEHAGESDGYSTLVFLEYVNEHDGSLVSVDKNEETEQVCRSLLIKTGLVQARVKFRNEDAIKFFQLDHEAVVDLLYLDGWDLNDPDSAKQHLLCFLLAEKSIKPGGLVLIDDTGYPDLGKGKLVVPAAVLMGWTVLHQGFQTLIRKTV